MDAFMFFLEILRVANPVFSTHYSVSETHFYETLFFMRCEQTLITIEQPKNVPVRTSDI